MRPTDLLYLKFFAVTFTTLFFGASLAGTLSNEKIKPTLGTAALVGLFALGWISGIVPTHNQGIITAIVAVTFATGAYLNFNITRVKESVYTFTAIACILLVAATGYQFDGPTLVITFAVQAMILPIFAHKYLSKKLGYSLLLYHILPLITSLDSWSSREWDCPQSLMPSLIPGSSNNYSTFGCTSSIFHADFFALLIVTASLALTGYYFYQLKYSSDNKQEKRLHNAGVILVVMGTIYGLLLIARTLTAVMAHEDTARMILLIIYTIVGLTVYLNGQVENRIVRNRFGLILLLLVIGRLLLVEVWDMNIAGRIITFFLIGTLLMSSVLLRSSHKTGQT